jgi:2-amino-4-hydroxy-6-hydroxymethyldihydropteridine diphosphokinase
MKYFLSLGSNLGDRRKNISRALAFLDQENVKVVRSSSLYKTQPVGYAAQPWFYNQVIEVATRLNPYDLLDVIKKIESKLKRQPAVSDGPRTLDIDILLAEKSIIQTKKLIIPHPRLDKRKFVLTPLKELSPEAYHPVLRLKIRDLLKKSVDPSVVKKLKKRRKRILAATVCKKSRSS